MPQLAIKHHDTRSPIIENPRTDCIYHLRYNKDSEILIVFTGRKHRDFVDVSTFITYTQGPLPIKWCQSKEIIVLPRNTLPRQFDIATMPPILLYSKQEGIYAPSAIEYNLNTATGVLEAEPTNIASPINETLERYYQHKLKTPLSCGFYPIFDESRPSYEFIESLYQAFNAFNNHHKLAFQYEHSKGMCHIRAHFMSEFLRSYAHIPTLKVYKYWRAKDWAAFHQNKAWNFHTSMAIIDEQSALWVWDPWVGNNPKLLTLEQWLYRHDEPLPTKCMLAHHSIISDIKEGLRPDGQLFMRIMNKKSINAFQTICSNAIPNPPERPILSNAQILKIGIRQYRLFAVHVQKKLKTTVVQPPQNEQLEKPDVPEHATKTKELIGHLSRGYKKIGNFITSPISWACGENSQEPDEVCGVQICKACLKLSCCCIATAITAPTGIAAGLGLTLFGCFSVPAAALTDKTKTCWDKPPSHSMN